MRRVHFYTFILLFLLSCHRNSTEINPVSIPDNNVQVILKNNGLNIAEVEITQKYSIKSDSVIFSVQNLTAETLTNISFYLEYCSGEPSYDSCETFLKILIPYEIAPFGSTGEIISYNSKNRNIIQGIVNGGIITLGKKDSITYSGVYHSGEILFYNTKRIAAYNGLIKGYVSNDGYSVFRIKTNTGENYNIDGLFTGDTIFFGDLFENGTPINKVRKDTISKLISYSNNTLNLSLLLDSIISDSVSVIRINTSK